MIIWWWQCTTFCLIKYFSSPSIIFHFAGGDVLSWGLNSHGQLGLGREVSLQYTPVLVRALSGVAVTQISAGATHTLFLTLPGLVYCCGANKSGQLGLNRVDETGTNNCFHCVTNWSSIKEDLIDRCQTSYARVSPHHLQVENVTAAAVLPLMPPAGNECHSCCFILKVAVFLMILALTSHQSTVYIFHLIHQNSLYVSSFCLTLTGRFNICMVPALRPLAVSSISCGEAHSAVLTKVQTSPVISAVYVGSIYRMRQSYAVICRMARFSLLERDAMASSVTAPPLMNWSPDWSRVWTGPPHRFHAAGKNHEGVYVNTGTVKFKQDLLNFGWQTQNHV